MSFIHGLLSNVESKFYFGIGGIGDFLLLMSTFYDDIKENTDVVFVCNNVSAIREMSRQFSQVKNWWFYPRSSFHSSPIFWEAIIGKDGFLGSGVTPRQFMYINDWIKCGDSNVFDYYGVRKDCKWASPIETLYNKHIVIHPCGGKDQNRISRIPIEYIQKIIKKFGNDYEIILIGCEKDEIEYGGVIGRDHPLYGAKWLAHELELATHYIRSAEFVIAVNSWVKSYSGIAGIKTYIYPSSYIRDPQKAYGWHKDPADTVFLDNWGFKDAMELVKD